MKPEPLWSVNGDGFSVERHDFQLHKKSNPPPMDAEPETIQFPKTCYNHARQGEMA